MQVLLNTDNHIRGTEGLTAHVESIVTATLDRFADRITRVEVHLTDQNSRAKGGGNDIRCLMEARLAGLQPITVQDDGESVDQVLDSVVEKLERTIQRTLGQIHDSKDRVSFGGDQKI